MKIQISTKISRFARRWILAAALIVVVAPPAFAQQAPGSKPNFGSFTDKRQKLENDLLNNLISLDFGDDAKLIYHGSCGALVLLGLPVDKNCVPTAAAGNQTYQQRLDSSLTTVFQDASKSYIGKSVITSEHFSCEGLRALGLPVTPDCAESAILSTERVLGGGAVPPTDGTNPIVAGLKIKPIGAADEEIADFLSMLINDIEGFTPVGKCVKTATDFCGDLANIIVGPESEVKTDFINHIFIDALVTPFSSNIPPVLLPGASGVSLGPSVICTSGYSGQCQVLALGSSSAAPMGSGAVSPSDMAAFIRWMSSSGSGDGSSSGVFSSSSSTYTFGQMIFNPVTGEICRAGETCPVTIIDPNAPVPPPPPPPHFADGRLAPPNWPNCNPLTGMCGPVILYDPIPVDGGIIHMSQVPGDPSYVDPMVQEPAPQMSDTVSQDALPCEVDPTQPRCALPDATSMLGDIMGALPAVTSEGSPLQQPAALPASSDESQTSPPSKPLPSVSLMPTGQWNPAGDASSGARLNPFIPFTIVQTQSTYD